MKKTTLNSWRIILMVFLAIIAIYSVQQQVPFLASRSNFLELVEANKDVNAFFIYYVLVGTLLCCLFVPMSWIKVGAALTMGFGKGLLAAILIANLFFVLSFAIGRLMGKIVLTDWIEKESEKRQINYEVFKQNIEHNGMYYILYLRNIPVVSSALVNYLAAITTISFRDYFLGSFFGMLPGTFLLVALFSNIAYWKENAINTILMLSVVAVYYLIMHHYARKHMTVQTKV